MEKLIELLNKYEKSGLNEFEKYEEWWYCKWNGKILRGNWENDNELNPYELCSKQYGFIERLVKNDKIDFEKIKEKTGLNIEFELYNTMEYFFEKDALSIMLLSIQDNPIEYLCSILKE